MPLDTDDFQMNTLAAVKRLLDEETIPLKKKLEDQEKAHQETVDGYKGLVGSLQAQLEQQKEIISKCVDSVTGLAQLQETQGKSFTHTDGVLAGTIEGIERALERVEEECSSLGGALKALDLLAEKVEQVEAKIPEMPKLPDYDDLKKSAVLSASEEALRIAQEHIKEPQIGPMGYIKDIKAEVKGRKLHLFMETSNGEVHECEGELPTPEFAGPYKSNKTYGPNAITSHNYAVWIATKDTSAEPGNSGDWKLMVKAPRGKPGVSVKDFIAVEGGVTAKMSDGEEIFVDVHKA